MNKNALFKTINGYDIVMEMMAGSHLYGTDTPESDKDYIGVILPAASEVFGFNVMKELDVSIVSKLENGKNSKDATDRKFYEFRHFVKLAAENNPNIIELLFVNSDSLLVGSYISDLLLSKVNMFVDHNKIYTKYLAYAGSQKHKMLIKPENYTEIIRSLDFLYDYIGTNTLSNLSDPNTIKKSKQLLLELNDKIIGLQIPINFNSSFISIGDLNLNKSITVKAAITTLAERAKKAGSRTDLYVKYGFDTKFGSHCVRLLLEALSLLKEGKISFPLEDAPFIREIKCGKYTKEQTVAIIKDLEKQVECVYNNLKVKKSCDKQGVENLVVSTLQKYFLCAKNS